MRFTLKVLVCVGCLFVTGSRADTESSEFFNGKNTDGWEGLTEYWKVENGAIIGDTGKGGEKVEDRPVQVSDFLATVCLALGMDPLKFNNSNVGRTIRIVEKGAEPIKEVLQA